MKTRTFPPLIRRTTAHLNGVIHHEKTDANPLGQSGMHTIVDDIINIVLNSQTEQDAWNSLHYYLIQGEVEIPE